MLNDRQPAGPLLVGGGCEAVGALRRHHVEGEAGLLAAVASVRNPDAVAVRLVTWKDVPIKNSQKDRYRHI